MPCYECMTGREAYYNRPEDGRRTSGGLCRDCYERRIREIGERDAEKQFTKAQFRRVRQHDEDELIREIAREEDAFAALTELTE